MLSCSIHLHSTVMLSCPIHLHPTKISNFSLCVCVCLCAWLWEWECVLVCVRVCACVCTHVCVCVHACVCACIVCVCAWMCACACVCVCWCAYAGAFKSLSPVVYGCAKESVSAEDHYGLGMPSAHYYYYDYCFTLHWTALLRQLPWWPYGPHTWTTGLCGSVWSMCSDPTLSCRYGWPQRKGSICNAEINN